MVGRRSLRDLGPPYSLLPNCRHLSSHLPRSGRVVLGLLPFTFRAETVRHDALENEHSEHSGEKNAPEAGSLAERLESATEVVRVVGENEIRGSESLLQFLRLDLRRVGLFRIDVDRERHLGRPCGVQNAERVDADVVGIGVAEDLALLPFVRSWWAAGSACRRAELLRSSSGRFSCANWSIKRRARQHGVEGLFHARLFEG